MAITEADINEMLAFLVTHPEYQERFRTVTAAPELSAIPSRMDRVEAALERLVVAGAATDARIDRLATRMDILTDRMTGLTERVDVVAEKMDQLGDTVGVLAGRVEGLTGEVGTLTVSVNTLGGRVDKISGDVGNLKGGNVETRYNNNIENWFSDYVVAPRKVTHRSVPEVEAALSMGTISPAELRQLHDLDMMVRGNSRETGEDTILAVELSRVIDRNDVTRAANRAAVLRKSGCRAQGFVGGYSILEAARQEAERADVIIDLHEPTR